MPTHGTDAQVELNTQRVEDNIVFMLMFCTLKYVLRSLTYPVTIHDDMNSIVFMLMFVHESMY